MKRVDAVNGDYFADRLRELRKAAGLTQKQLAKKIGVVQRTIIYLESGGRNPSWKTVLALADALNVECTAFREEPPK